MGGADVEPEVGRQPLDAGGGAGLGQAGQERDDLVEAAVGAVSASTGPLPLVRAAPSRAPSQVAIPRRLPAAYSDEWN